ncbi:MAG: hypothetical protein AAB071_00685 [Bacteroidota bacterium]
MQNTSHHISEDTEILETILSVSDEILKKANEEDLDEVTFLLTKRGELIQNAILQKDFLKQSARQRRLQTKRTLELLQEREIHLKKIFKEWSDRIFNNLQEAQKLKQISNYVSPKIISRGTL